MITRYPIHCIIPPYLVERLIEKTKEPAKRQKLMQMLALSARIRGRREVMGQLPVGTASDVKRRAVYDAQNDTHLPGKCLRREGDPPCNDEAANEAYEGLGATYDLFHDEYGRHSLDDRGMTLVASVHYDEGFDNAFWDGQQMVFGDGDGELFTGFTKSLDVIAHELTHGVVDNTAGLEYRYQSGALNESMADVFGILVKQRRLHQRADEADWLIGAEIFTPLITGDALRSMKEPGKAFDGDEQKGHIKDYRVLPFWQDNGGVHIYSGIPNRAFYLAATAIGGYAWKDAGHIWYTALRKMNPDTNFQQAADMTFQTAGEMFGSGSSQQQAVRAGWEEVGIKPGGKAGPTKSGRLPEEHTPEYDGRIEKLTREVSEMRSMIETIARKMR